MSQFYFALYSIALGLLVLAKTMRFSDNIPTIAAQTLTNRLL